MLIPKSDTITIVPQNSSRLVGYIAKRADKHFFYTDWSQPLSRYSDYLQVYSIADLTLPYVQLLPENMRNREVCVVFAENNHRYQQIVRDLGIPQ